MAIKPYLNNLKTYKKNKIMKIKNAPKKIYLQIGEIDKNETADFNKIYDNFTEVTWCKDQIYDSDIEYRLKENNKTTRNKKIKGIITLCGSTKFYDTIQTIDEELTKKGYITFGIKIIKNKSENIDEQDKHLEETLNILHREKILMSDFIFVIDQANIKETIPSYTYIGKNTKNEIEFAKKHKKRIYKLSNGDLNKL